MLPTDLPLGYHRVFLRSGDYREQHRPHRDAGLARPAGDTCLPPRLGTGHPAVQRAVRQTPGAWATSPTWPISRSGRLQCMAPTMCWSTRCTPRRRRDPRRWSRWNPRRICRPRGASSIRSIFASKPFPSSSTCPSAAGCGSCATRCRTGPTGSTASTVTAHGPPNARHSNSSTGYRDRRVASWPTPPSAPGRAALWTTSPPGARWPKNTAATGIGWPKSLRHPVRGRGRRLRRKECRCRRFPPLAAVATGRAARRGAVAGHPGRNVAGHHA